MRRGETINSARALDDDDDEDDDYVEVAGFELESGLSQVFFTLPSSWKEAR